MHEGGGRWVGSNKLVELKKKKRSYTCNHGSVCMLRLLSPSVLLSPSPNVSTECKIDS